MFNTKILIQKYEKKENVVPLFGSSARKKLENHEINSLLCHVFRVFCCRGRFGTGTERDVKINKGQLVRVVRCYSQADGIAFFVQRGADERDSHGRRGCREQEG